MSLINIEEIDRIFDTMKVVNEKKPEIWRDQIVEQLSSNNGIDEFRDLAKLKAIIQNFVEKQEISCVETIYQTDRVIENAYELIENLVEIVGYKEYDDDE